MYNLQTHTCAAKIGSEVKFQFDDDMVILTLAPKNMRASQRD